MRSVSAGQVYHRYDIVKVVGRCKFRCAVDMKELREGGGGGTYRALGVGVFGAGVLDADRATRVALSARCLARGRVVRAAIHTITEVWWERKVESRAV